MVDRRNMVLCSIAQYCLLFHQNFNLYCLLKLARTDLNYCVLGSNTAAIFLSNDLAISAPITLDECHA